MIRNNTVLIVDDDEAVLSTLCKAVRAAGLETETATNAEAALNILGQDTVDLILMDVNMPGMDGFEAIQRIRGMNIATPIIIISGRKEDSDTVYGLNIGADDYVTKPFNPVTIGAKIKALIRLSKMKDSSVNQTISAGPFSFDVSSLRFYKNGEEIMLTSKECAMMKLFIDNTNRIFTKDMLYDLVWHEIIPDDNTIMVYVNKLRQKIEDNPSEPRYIQTVRGLGYRFVAE